MRRNRMWSRLSPEPTLDGAETAFFADLQGLLFSKKRPLPQKISRICAVDAAYRGDAVVAVATVYEDGRFSAESEYSGRCTFPYLSGLFYLREGPFVVETVRRLKVRPQLLCFDAHGAAHPRSAGLATVCGMVLGIPSLGMAKSLLVGRAASGAGGLDTILHNGRSVGFVTKVENVTRYWSPGYSINLRGLELVVRRYAPTCLGAMAESDGTARGRIQTVSQ